MKRVLVADDKATGRELVRTVLQRSGYEVLEAANGMDALDSARRENPDLIILDLYMAEMDGSGVIQELRRNKSLRDTPIIALTASAMMSDQERALSLGFTDYITKPIRPSTLREEVMRLLP